MSEKKTNPESSLDKQDAAQVKNYTRVPNMLIFGYHDTLSPQEKWLHVCLKHMCGKKGTRHLSLRYIAEKTGISVGALSKSKSKQGVVNEGMIKHLHDAGLIHAEIKKHDGKGNAQYHITITDVWTLNQAFFDATCPNPEQVDNEDTEPVQDSDEPVRTSDKLVQNSDEPVRIPVQYQDYNKDYNKREKQEESVSAAHEDTHPSFPNSSPSLPSDHNQVESLPTENKAVVNPPPFTRQERAERRKWAAYINEDENITREDVLKGLDLCHQWVAAYGAYGKAPWCDKALIWIAQQSNGTWENVQKVYDALPETAINPEKVASNWHRLNGKKKASRDDAPSTPLDTERNERNLQNLLKRAAEKRAAQATTE